MAKVQPGGVNSIQQGRSYYSVGRNALVYGMSLLLAYGALFRTRFAGIPPSIC